MSPLVSMLELRRQGIEAMQQYAQTYGGEYQTFTFIKPPKLLRTHRGCPVEYYLKSESTGDSNAPPMLTTQIRAPFANTTGFTIEIIRRARVARLLNKHGKHSAETGDTVFNETFAVKSADPEMARQFLSDPAYRAMLLETSSGLDVADKKESGLFNRRSKDVHYVKFFVYSYLTDIASIDKAFALVDRTLDRLATLGQARLSS
jgi:hypothetical protein